MYKSTRRHQRGIKHDETNGTQCNINNQPHE